MKLDGKPFTNSPTCKGIAFAVAGAPLDFSVIEISGRYPEDGWAVNDLSHEEAYVEKGTGTLEIRDGKKTNLKPGDVVLIPPDTPFAWEGELKLIMACQPAFDPEHYEIEED